MRTPSSDKSVILYERIASELEQLIQQGALREGDKLPSLRELSRERGVSMSTALQAYLTLESKGLVLARDRSGFYVQRTTDAQPPTVTLDGPLAGEVTVIDMILNVLDAARDPSCVPLGAGVPSPALMPIEEMARMLAKVCREAPEAIASYSFAPGTLALRRQIARDAGSFGCTLGPDDLVTTSGGMEALNLCLRAVARPGDAVAIESPTYFGILQMVESLGMRAVEIPTDPTEGISLEALKAAIRCHDVKACVLIPTFQNPLGTCMSDEKKRALVELLADDEVPLVEDDVYGDLALDGHRPVPCKAYDKHGLVLWVGSFSKTIGAGLRVGWCAPGRFYREVLALRGATSLANTTPAELAIAQFLERGGYRRSMRALRRTLAEQLRLARNTVIKSFPEGTRISQPYGGFLLWVELPEGIDSVTLHQRALKEKISFMPGPVFSASGSFRNCLRLSCAAVWSEEIKRGIERIGDLACELERNATRRRHGTAGEINTVLYS